MDIEFRVDAASIARKLKEENVGELSLGELTKYVGNCHNYFLLLEMKKMFDGGKSPDYEQAMNVVRNHLEMACRELDKREQKYLENGR